MNPVCPSRGRQRRHPCIPNKVAILSFAEWRIRFLQPESEFPGFPEASR